MPGHPEINIFLGAFQMEIILGALIVGAGLYYIWAKAEKAKTAAKESEAPYKVETPVKVVGSDIAFDAPATTPVVVAAPVTPKPKAAARTAKPKAPAASKAKAPAKPKAEAKPKAPRKPKMQVAK